MYTRYNRFLYALVENTHEIAYAKVMVTSQILEV